MIENISEIKNVYKANNLPKNYQHRFNKENM